MNSAAHETHHPTAAGSLFRALRGERIVHVRNLEEARRTAAGYDAVLTAGPEPDEVRGFAHDNHYVTSFEDVPSEAWMFAPTISQVEDAIMWGAAQHGRLLVHCHYGISRSTAIAWGVLMTGGQDPESSIRLLLTGHPTEADGSRREFAPNRLIVKHLAVLFNRPGLIELRDQVVP